VLALWHGRPPVSAEVVRFAVYPSEKTAYSAALNITVDVPQFGLSPDGRTLAFVASPAGAGPTLWLRPLAELTARSLPGTENAQSPFWSPDRRWLGFYADGRVKKISVADGTVRVVAETQANFLGGTWAPDDTILFASGTEPIYRINAAGGTATQATIIGAPGEVHRFPYFLPDGHHFLFTLVGVDPSGVDPIGVYAGSLDSPTKKLLLHSSTSAVYAPGGYLLFVDGDTLMGQTFDAERLELSGRPFVVAEHAGHNTAGLSAIATSHDGTIAYAGTLLQEGRLIWFDRGGSALGPIGSEGDYADFRLSRGEKSLAASRTDPKTGRVDIWMIDLVRNSPSRFASGGNLTGSPVWSADGARLIYRTTRIGSAQFFQRSAGGGGSEVPVLTSETERAVQMRSTALVPTDWSPDGAHLLFSVPAPASGNDLWMLPLAGDKKPVKFLATSAEEMHGNFSPDGGYVAYTSNESGRFEVQVQSFPLSDKKWTVSTNGGYEPRWRADGGEIYYLSEDRKLMASSVGTGLSFGVPVPLFQTRVPSRDGKRFLVNTNSGDPAPTPIMVVLNWTAGLKK
jgi:Tol biopolymer transport system component